MFVKLRFFIFLFLITTAVPLHAHETLSVEDELPPINEQSALYQTNSVDQHDEERYFPNLFYNNIGLVCYGQD